MDLKERIAFYEKNYGIAPLHVGKGKKMYIGDKKDRYCRFCGRKGPEAKFKNIAHALPEFLGNKQVILLQECDECNSFFSENIEVHLDKFTRPFRLISQIKGKTKVPSYKTKDGNSRIDFDKEQGLISSETIDQRISDIDFEKKRLTLTFNYEPYVPAAVYKSFVKMALSVIHEEELPPFQKAIKWILNADHSKKIMNPQIIKVLFIPGVNPNRIVASFFLRRKKNVEQDDLPYSIFVLGFGNFVCQLMVPSSNDFKGSKTISFKFSFFPTPFELGGQTKGLKFLQWDLSGHEVIRGRKETITFNYGNIEEIKG